MNTAELRAGKAALWWFLLYNSRRFIVQVLSYMNTAELRAWKAALWWFLLYNSRRFIV